MKKIYRTIVLLSATAVLGTSCSDWLNVYPSDQIKEEFLFETGNGYRAALFTGKWLLGVFMEAILNGDL